MKKISWHIIRAALMLSWLFVNKVDDQRVSPTLACMLVFCAAYDIVLACVYKLNVSVSKMTQQIIATMILSIALLLIWLERSPWDNVIGFIPIWLYSFEAIAYMVSRKKKWILSSSLIVLSMVTVFLSLYEVGWTYQCLHASLTGRPVSCRVIKFIRSSDIVVIANNDWLIIHKKDRKIEEACAYRSLTFGNLALVDTRYRTGIIIDKDEIKTGWNPNMLYKNGRLSFYIEPNKLLVCNEIKF